MFQDGSSIQFEPMFIDGHPEPTVKIYVLVFLIALAVMLVRLLALWIAAPPFRLSRQAKNPGFIDKMQAMRASMKQWMGCMLLGSAFVACTQLVQSCDRLLASNATNAGLVYAVRDIAVSINLGLFAALLLFLAQWHLHRRIERLLHGSDKTANL
jgi:hypothetical protein